MAIHVQLLVSSLVIWLYYFPGWVSPAKESENAVPMPSKASRPEWLHALYANPHYLVRQIALQLADKKKFDLFDANQFIAKDPAKNDSDLYLNLTKLEELLTKENAKLNEWLKLDVKTHQNQLRTLRVAGLPLMPGNPAFYDADQIVSQLVDYHKEKRELLTRKPKAEEGRRRKSAALGAFVAAEDNDQLLIQATNEEDPSQRMRLKKALETESSRRKWQSPGKIVRKPSGKNEVHGKKTANEKEEPQVEIGGSSKEQKTGQKIGQKVAAKAKVNPKIKNLRKYVRRALIRIRVAKLMNQLEEIRDEEAGQMGRLSDGGQQSQFSDGETAEQKVTKLCAPENLQNLALHGFGAAEENEEKKPIGQKVAIQLGLRKFLCDFLDGKGEDWQEVPNGGEGEQVEKVVRDFHRTDPALPHSLGVDFRFSLFFPVQFQQLWHRIQENQAQQLLLSLTEAELEGFDNPAASKAVFFTSWDGQFFVKSIRKERIPLLEAYAELDFFFQRDVYRKQELRWTSAMRSRNPFRGALMDYFEHFERNPKSFLPRFFALFKFEPLKDGIPSGEAMLFFVQNGLFPRGIPPIEAIFDLKGASHHRWKQQEDEEKERRNKLRENAVKREEKPLDSLKKKREEKGQHSEDGSRTPKNSSRTPSLEEGGKSFSSNSQHENQQRGQKDSTEKEAQIEKKRKGPKTHKDLDLIRFEQNGAKPPPEGAFPNGILLSPQDFGELEAALREDSKFLAEHDIVDYSLLLGVHFANDGEEVEKMNRRWHKQGYIAECVDCHSPMMMEQNIGSNGFGEELKQQNEGERRKWRKLWITIGVIDVLQAFNFGKRMEFFWKDLVVKPPYSAFPLGRKHSFCSIIPPVQYQQRFFDFLTTVVFSGNRRLEEDSTGDEKEKNPMLGEKAADAPKNSSATPEQELET